MFFAALVINALYPAVLLFQRNARLNRRAVAVVDVALDLVYSAVFFFAMLLNGMFAAALPTDPLQWLSLLSPAAHIMFTCRAVEVAAADLRARRQAHDNSSRRLSRKASMRTTMALTGRVEAALPIWKGARFAFVALVAVAVALFARCGERYPLVGTIPGPCGPCVCSDAGVLLDCRYHAELKDPFLWVEGRGVTEVEQDAFKGNEGAAVIMLNGEGSNITTPYNTIHIA